MAAWSKCQLSHVRVADLESWAMTTCESHRGEYAAPVRLWRVDTVHNRQILGMIMYPSASLAGHSSDGLSGMVLVRAEPHKGYVSVRVHSSGAYGVKALLQGHGKFGHVNDPLRQKAPRRLFSL